MEWKRNLRWLALVVALAAAGALAGPAGAAPAPRLPAPMPDAFDDPTVPMPDPDLWQRIRKGFLLEPLDSPLVHEHEDWYSSRPDYIKRFVDRGSLYLHHIVEEVEKRGMPMEIALLPVIESAFNPHAYSRSKASGLWQFIPSTGKNYGLSQDQWKDNRRDIVAATDAALNYLQRLYDMFGSWELALAAYNCGEGCVGRAIAANQRKGLPTDYLSLKLPPETMNYVPKLIAVKNIVLAPTLYGIDLESIPDQPYFTTVEAPEKIDVKLAARLAGMPEDEFIALNPAHNKPVAVAHTGTLVVPLDKADAFRENLGLLGPAAGHLDHDPGQEGRVDRRHREALRPFRHDAQAGEQPAGEQERAALGLAADPGARAREGGRAGRLRHPLARGGSAQAPAKAAAPASPPAAAPARTTSFYVVKAGDTLYGIARQFGRAVPDLLHLNNLSSRAVIQPGLRLRVQ